MEFDENLNPINQNNDPDWSKTPPPAGPQFDQRNNQPPRGNQPPATPPPPKKPDAPTGPLPEPPTPKPQAPGSNTALIGLMVATVLLAAVAIVAMATRGNPVVVPGGGESGSEAGIRAVGMGTANATPDVAKINFAVRTEARDVSGAQDANSQTLAEIKNQIARFNVAGDDIRTVQYNVYPEYDYFPSRSPRLRGYTAYHAIEITARKLSDADAIVQTIGSAGATDISNIRFTVDDPTEVQNEAREEAIAKAKDKAKQLAQLSGARLGKIISIEESSGPYTDYPYPMLDGRGGGSATPEVGLEEGSVEYTSTVTIIYSLN